jgi:ubiquinone/menaquinone biosynthesis C-methylase UbiE
VVPTEPKPDAYAAFARFEQEFWDRTGPVYAEGFGHVTSQTVPFLLRHLQMSPSATLLDVACGPGFISAALDGSGVTVVGADLSTEMIRLARTLNPRGTFEQADAAALPFADASFDAVSCNFGLLHFGDPPRAIHEGYRVLRGGGRYAYAVWDTPERNRALSIIMGAVKPYVAQTVMPEGPAFFRYADRAVGRRALEDAGFVEVAVEEVPMTWPIRSAATFLGFFREGGARIGEVLRQLTPAAAEEVETAVANGLADYPGLAPGEYAVPTAAVVFSGRKPPDAR